MTGRSILGALVRSQWRLGLCPKMKYHPLCGWIIISIKKVICKPVAIRAMPENEIPPAMRVDYYFKTNEKIAIEIV